MQIEDCQKAIRLLKSTRRKKANYNRLFKSFLTTSDVIVKNQCLIIKMEINRDLDSIRGLIAGIKLQKRLDKKAM